LEAKIRAGCSLHALSGFQSVIGELEGQWNRTEKLRAHWGITHTFTTANADGYSQNPIENRTAIFG